MIDGGATLSDRCASYIKGLLLDGGLDPGQPVSIAAVTRAMGVSRQPAMDAVKRLQAEGFIIVQPQIGCRVVSPRAEHVGDFFKLFARSEALVSRLAAERRTEEECGTLRDLANRVLRDSDSTGAPEVRDSRYRHVNRRLHRHIHDLARSPIAAEIAAAMWDRSDFYLRAAFGSLSFSQRVRSAQGTVVSAIIAGDGDAADGATVDHLERLGERTVKRLRARRGILS